MGIRKIIKSYSKTIVLVLIAILLLFTNPSEEQFKLHLKENIEKTGEDDQSFADDLSNWLSQLAVEINSASIERTDIKFFSIYTINVFNTKYTYIGILNSFIKINSKDLSEEE